MNGSTCTQLEMLLRNVVLLNQASLTDGFKLWIVACRILSLVCLCTPDWGAMLLQLGRVKPLFSSNPGVPKLLQLAAPLTYWAIGCDSLLGLQSYTLYKATGFSQEFCGAPGWFPQLPGESQLTVWEPLIEISLFSERNCLPIANCQAFLID